MNKKIKSLTAKTVSVFLTLGMCLQMASGTCVYADENNSCVGNYTISSISYAPDMYLVTFDPDEVVSKGTVQYKGNDMFWSEKYGQWCILTDGTDVPAALDFTANAESTREDVSYTGDVNLSGKVNIVDAQITYDLARGGVYADYSKLNMSQWLSADFNTDGSVSALDARAIQVYVHTGTYDGQDSEGTLLTGMHITKNGTYRLKSGTSGKITIDPGLTVMLVGIGTQEAFNELYIECGAGDDLTLKNMFISNTADENIINFTGLDNVLRAAGVNVLEANDYVASAAIHVGPDTELVFEESSDADGKLYLYKKTQGSGVGSDAEEANGRITFNGGNWFFKGTKTGAVIGNDTCGDAENEAQIGDITINGGVIYIEANARGAAIGGSSMSRGGNVYMTGGTVGIWTDWSGSAVGAGMSALADGNDAGKLTVTGGSLRVYVNANSAGCWGISKAQACDLPLTVQKVNADGEKVVRYVLDVSAYEVPYEVTVDGENYYHGIGYAYDYDANVEDTIENWPETTSEHNIYIYVSEGSHMISVNGDTESEIKATEPDYAEAEVTVPDESWSVHTDTDWYNSEDTSFTITTAEQLAGLAEIVNAGTDTFEGKTVILGADIDLESYAWVPIGCSFIEKDSYGITYTIRRPFSGVFEGQDHKIISPLFDDVSACYVGIFGYIDNGEVNDLNVSGGYLRGSYDIGAIAGYAVSSSFNCCTSNVSLEAQPNGSTGGGQAGYLEGGILGNGILCTITDCENYGTLKANRYLGGIAGSLSGTVTGCTNYGACTTGNEFCSGIVACQYGVTEFVSDKSKCILNISDCTNNGKLSGLAASGIVALTCYNTSFSIENCVNNGDISCGCDGGGIVGYIAEKTTGIVNECVNNGAIRASTGDGSGVGGIAGEARSGSITGCVNNGSITASGAKTIYYGGIVGHIQCSSFVITECRNNGMVKAVGSKRSGGIAGGLLINGVAETDYESVFESAASGWNNNVYVKETASCGFGGAYTTNDACFRSAGDISEKMYADPETVTD